MECRRWAAFTALSVIWGSGWIATGTLAGHIPLFFGGAVRFALAAFLLLPLILWRRLKMPRGRTLSVILILSVTMVAAPFAALVWATPHVSSSISALLFAATPFLAAAVTPRIAGQRVSRRSLEAMLIGFGGMALVLWNRATLAEAGGAALVLAAVTSIAVSGVYARRELAHVNPLVSAAILLGMAAVFLALISMGSERGQPLDWNADTVGSLVLLGALGGGAGFPLYFRLLQSAEAYQVATVQWVEPLVAIAEGATLLRQRIPLDMIAGAAVALVSLVVVMRARADDDNPVTLQVQPVNGAENH